MSNIQSAIEELINEVLDKRESNTEDPVIDLDTRLDSVESKIGDIDDLDTKVDDIDTKVDELENKMDNCQESMEELKSENDELKSSLKELELSVEYRIGEMMKTVKMEILEEIIESILSNQFSVTIKFSRVSPIKVKVSETEVL